MTKLIDVNETSLKDILKFCEAHAEKMGIKLVYGVDEMCSASIYTKEIHINTKHYKKNTIPFAYFHEVGHFKIFERNLFKDARDIHTKNSFDKLTAKDKVIYKQTVLRIEQWCDIYGEKESSKYFKNVNAYKPYFTKNGKSFIRENYYY